MWGHPTRLPVADTEALVSTLPTLTQHASQRTGRFAQPREGGYAAPRTQAKVGHQAVQPDTLKRRFHPRSHHDTKTLLYPGKSSCLPLIFLNHLSTFSVQLQECNSLLSGFCHSSIAHSHSLLISEIRLIFSDTHNFHVTPLLRQLNLLPSHSFRV